MKRVFLLLVTIIAIFMSLSAIETKIGMEVWARYSGTTEKNGSEYKLSSSAVSVERGYLGIEPKFSDAVKGRFTIDLFSDEDGTDGAGLKVKYAYLDFSNKYFGSESYISAGLIKTYFGAIYDWNYTTVEKSFDDKEKVVASADYGISLNGIIPSGYGEYALSIYNGEGYSKTGGDVDVNPALALNLRILPLTGVTLGGSVYYEDKTLFSDTASAGLVSDTARLCYTGVGRIAYAFIDLSGQILVQKIDDVLSSGYMLMPVIKLSKVTAIDIDILGRYDRWDKNTDGAVSNDSYSRIGGGMNFNLLRDESNKPSVILQADYQRALYEDSSKSPVDNLYLQLRWNFANTLN